jgi:hypothetical protein
MKASLTQQIETSTYLYLLHGRLEPLDGQPPTYRALCLRYCLTDMTVPKHRIALTQLLLSDHVLAVELLRRQTRACPLPVLRHQRLCWLCRHAVETPEHALLLCQCSQEVL